MSKVEASWPPTTSWTVWLIEDHTSAAPSTVQTIRAETTMTTPSAIESRNDVFIIDQGSMRVSRSRALRPGLGAAAARSARFSSRVGFWGLGARAGLTFAAGAGATTGGGAAADRAVWAARVTGLAWVAGLGWDEVVAGGPPAAGRARAGGAGAFLASVADWPAAAPWAGGVAGRGLAGGGAAFLAGVRAGRAEGGGGGG